MNDSHRLEQVARTIKGKPIRPTLVTFSIFLVLFTALSISLSTFFTSRTLIHNFWTQFTSEMGKKIFQELDLYFTSAVPFVKSSLSLLEEKLILIDDTDDLASYFYRQLTTHPRFLWIYIDRPDGSSVAAFRNQVKGTVNIWKSHIIQKPGEASALQVQIFEYGNNEQLHLVHQSLIPGKDPRQEPPYQLALKESQGGWTKPTFFPPGDYQGLAGVSMHYAAPIYLDGVFKGSLAIEFDITALSIFLKELQIHPVDQVYLVSDEGEIYSDADNLVSKQKEPLKIQNMPGTPIQSAWETAQASGISSGVFNLEGQIAYFENMTEHSTIPWSLFVLVSKEALFQSVASQFKMSLLQTALLIFICALLSSWLFSKISKRLKEIAYDTYHLSNFHFLDKPYPHSPIKEINILSTVSTEMKQMLYNTMKFLPLEVVRDQIFAEKEVSLGATEQKLTALVVDIKGFTSLTETEAPDQLIAILSEYLSTMHHIIDSHQGVISQYLGDGFMAFWNAPSPLKDHPLHACLAALDMREALAHLQKTWTSQNTFILEHRIGIHTGDALVGNIGSTTHMEYTAIGDMINIASKLEGINKEFHTDILISGEVAKHVEPFLSTHPLGTIPIPGKAEPIAIYSLPIQTPPSTDMPG